MKQSMSLSVLLMGLILLLACSPAEKPSIQKEQDQWLANEYSKPTTAAQSKLIKLPQSSTRFRQDILNGQPSKGMDIAEAAAALRLEPYGLLPNQTRYWCDENSVLQCQHSCIKCEAIMFGQSRIVFLEGFGMNPLVTDWYPNRFADFKATVDQTDASFAQQIYNHNIVYGMSAGVVQMIINRQNHQVNYYCDLRQTPSTASCLGSCDICQLEITPRFSSAQKQIIRLETHAGRQTVSFIGYQ